MSDIENLLDQVKQIVKTHNEHANKQGENFNIFSILRMGRKEVETHSLFIYELLHPDGSHGQGDDFLKSFTEIVLGREDYGNAKNPRREDKTDEGRFIDFTLETDNALFAIEMKIDADDQRNQLFDYHKALEKRAGGKEVSLFYLTLDGSEASKYSLGELTENDYKCISFSRDILNWINDCIQQSAEKSVLREALIQYKFLIKKLTGQNTTMNTEIAKLISDTTDNFQATMNLEKGLTEAKINLKYKFWKDLLKELGEENGFKFGNKYDSLEIKHSNIKYSCNIYYTESRNNSEQGIIYKLDNIKISLVAVKWLAFNLDPLDHQKWYACTDKKGVIENIKDKIGGKFFPKDIKINKDININFRDCNDQYLALLDQDHMQYVIKSLAQEFKELIKTLENNQ